MDIEYGNCDMCNVQSPLQRKYYYYDIKCDCCNNKKDNHFEIVRYCPNCKPKPPRRINASIKPLVEEIKAEDVKEEVFIYNEIYDDTQLTDFQVRFLTDLKIAFPNNKVEFGRGDRILIDGKIVPGLLCNPPRLPYDDNFVQVIDLIKQMMKNIL